MGLQQVIPNVVLNLPSVKLLLEAGADVNLEEFIGSPLCVAACQGDAQCVKVLLNAGANGREALEKAAAQREKDAIKMLLESGVDVNQTDKYGETALCSQIDLSHNATAGFCWK